MKHMVLLLVAMLVSTNLYAHKPVQHRHNHYRYYQHQKVCYWTPSYDYWGYFVKYVMVCR